MAYSQFFTTCRQCGKQILMTRNLEHGYWIPCNPCLYRFEPDPHGDTLYVTADGIQTRGKKNREGMFGYIAHKRTCAV